MGLGSTKKAIQELSFQKIFKGISSDKRLRRIIKNADNEKLNTTSVDNEVIETIENSKAFKDEIEKYNVIEAEKRVIAMSYLIKAKAVIEMDDLINDFANENHLNEVETAQLKGAIMNGNEGYFNQMLAEDTPTANFCVRAMNSLYSYDIKEESLHHDENRYIINAESINRVNAIIERLDENLEAGFDEDETKYFEEVDEFEDPDTYRGLEDEENYFNNMESESNPYENYNIMNVIDYDIEYPEDAFIKKTIDGVETRYDGVVLKDNELIYDSEVPGMSGYIRNVYGFTIDQEMKYGWREKGTTYSKDDIIVREDDKNKAKPKNGDVELIFSSDSEKAEYANERSRSTGTLKIGKNDRNVTPKMVYDCILDIASKTGMTSAQSIYNDLLAIRNNVLNGILGKGNPIAAYKCFRSAEAEKQNIIQYDYNKIKEIKNLTSDKALAKATIKVMSEMDPVNDFEYNYNNFTKSNPDDRESVELTKEQTDKLASNLKEMKELRSARGPLYWLRHPINNFIEWRNISNCEEILSERGVDPASYQPELTEEKILERYEAQFEKPVEENDRLAVEIEGIFDDKDLEKNVLIGEDINLDLEKENGLGLDK